jgi:hypothetical protein
MSLPQNHVWSCFCFFLLWVVRLFFLYRVFCMRCCISAISLGVMLARASSAASCSCSQCPTSSKYAALIGNVATRVSWSTSRFRSLLTSGSVTQLIYIKEEPMVRDNAQAHSTLQRLTNGLVHQLNVLYPNLARNDGAACCVRLFGLLLLRRRRGDRLLLGRGCRARC